MENNDPIDDKEQERQKYDEALRRFAEKTARIRRLSEEIKRQEEKRNETRVAQLRKIEWFFNNKLQFVALVHPEDSRTHIL